MSKISSKSKWAKNSTKEELMKFDKNDLIDRIIQVEAHNSQLKNIIAKNYSNGTENETNIQQRLFDFAKSLLTLEPSKSEPTNFSKDGNASDVPLVLWVSWATDITSYQVCSLLVCPPITISHFRRVLIHILYFGWDYQGLAVQEVSSQTIEHHLFHALTKSCLIESRETSHYHRCGRTDKGVSAFGQVISISLRSKYPPHKQHEEESLNSELQYCKLLNRLLPKDIRAVAWMPIPGDMPEYSARFDCKRRQYKYYFPRSSLDIDAMRAACKYLLGSNDYRHLCKMDIGNGVTEFRREIFKAEIVAVDEKNTLESTSMYYLLIEGNAFLWHQIRCIMGVLLLVGQKRETPDVVSELLDIEKYPSKPQYAMALHVPLNLFHCSYELEKDRKWIFDRDELRNVIMHLQFNWTIHSIKATMTMDAIQILEKEYYNLNQHERENSKENECDKDRLMYHTDSLLEGVKSKVYKPLLKRDTCISLEERLNKKKRKLTGASDITDQANNLE